MPRIGARRRRTHTEPLMHRGGVERIGWLRAAMLGGNDGIVSIAALLIGVAAAGSSRTALLVAGLAGLVAGAASMGAGEYVSVSSQRDLEHAVLHHERRELAADPEGELLELAHLYERQGIDTDLAHRVAEQLMERDPLRAHAREELGLTDELRARPWAAAVAGAAAFLAGAIVPLVGLVGPTTAWRVTLIVGLSLGALALAGTLGARLGGANQQRAALRVLAGGSIAMAVSALAGQAVGAIV